MPNIRVLLKTLVLSASVTLPAFGLQKTASIRGRPECDASLYVDPPVTLSAVVDTAALTAALAPSRRDLEGLWVILEYGVNGQLNSIDLAADRRSKAERAAIAGPLAALFHPIPPQLSSSRLAVVYDSGSPGPIALRPVDFTCPAALTNLREVEQDFQNRITRLRATGNLQQASPSSVLVRFSVTADGRVLAPWIGQSSGFPQADSLALQAIVRARFRPAVAGRFAVTVPSGQPLQF
jgi:TonB family protein